MFRRAPTIVAWVLFSCSRLVSDPALQPEHDAGRVGAQTANSDTEASSDTAVNSTTSIALTDRASSRRESPRSEWPRDSIDRLAIPFQENDGQWDAAVAFKADHLAGTLWVTRSGRLVYSLLGSVDESSANAPTTAVLESAPIPDFLWQPTRTSRVGALPVSAFATRTPTRTAMRPENGDPSQRAQPRGRGWTLVESFVDGHPQVPRGLEQSTANVSYFVGDDASKWAPHVSAYRALTLGETWPGVEVRLVAHGRNVEKFFHVRAHRDPSRIEMRIDGADGLRLSRDGTLLVATGNGDVELSAPVAYQQIDGTHREVAVRYVLTGMNTYRFALSDYDRRYEVVIDPILQSTYLGGSSPEWAIEHASSVRIDDAGNVLVMGWSTSSDFPGVTGGAQSVFGSSQVIVLTRLNGTLTSLLQSTYLGGPSINYGYDDGGGNVLVVGSTNSSGFPGVAGGAQANIVGPADIVVSRLNGTLTAILQSTYLGGGGGESARGVAIDGSGNVVVVGNTGSGNSYPGLAGGAQSTSSGDEEMVVSRLNGQLTSLLQSTLLGGSLRDVGFGIAIATNADVVVVGQSQSTNYPGVNGGAQTSFGGAYDIVVSRLNTTLTSLLQIRECRFRGEISVVERIGFRTTQSKSEGIAAGC